MGRARYLTGLVSIAITVGVFQLVAAAAPAQADTTPKATWTASQVYRGPDSSSHYHPDDALDLASYVDRDGVYLVNLHNGARRTLASDPSGGGSDHAVVSGDGSTVVVQHGSIPGSYPHTTNTVTVFRGFDPTTLQGGTDTTYTYPQDRDMNSVALSDDGSRFVFGGQGVSVVDTQTGAVTEVVPPVDCPYATENQPFDYHQVAVSGDGDTMGDYVGANCNNGVNQARAYDITDLAHPAELWAHDQQGPPYPSQCIPTDRTAPIAVSDDGSRVAVSDLFSPSANLFHGDVLVHDLGGGGTDHTYFPDQGRICSVALSADGSRLAAEVGNPGYTGQFQQDHAWGQSIFVTDTTPSATPALIAEHTFEAQYNSYDDYGWGLDGLSGDGSAVLFSQRLVYPSAYQQLWIARDPSAAPLGWPAGATLTATQVAQTFVNLQWPAATGTVSSYRVTGGPAGPVDVPGGQTTATVSGLSPATAYHFGVVARNGGTSTDPLPLDVTTAGTAGPGSAALTATVTADDTVRLQWDPKAGTDSYQVLRGTGGGAVTPVATVAAGTTQWTDETTDGVTSYTYRVAAVTGGTPAPHTVDATVTTAAVALTSVIGLPTQALGYAVPGTTVTVHAIGQPHRTATAQLGLQGIAAPAPVALTETTSGHYDGTVTLPAGATHLDGVTVTSADSLGTGTGHVVNRTAITPLPVGGALVLHVDTSAFHGRAVLSSANGGWSVSSRLDLTGTLTRAVGVPPATDVQVSYVRDSDGVVLGTSGVSVGAGQVVELPARTLSDAAQLTLHTGPDVGGALLAVAQGTTEHQVRLDQDGDATLTGLDSGAQVKVSLVGADRETWRFEAMAPVTQQLAAGANTVELPLEARHEATLDGTAVASVPGVSMVGGTATVVQERGATSVTRSSTIDTSGHYAVTGLLSGLPTTVSVNQQHARSADPLAVSIGPGPNHEDVAVPVLDRYFVNPVLHLVDSHGVTSTEDVDFRTGAHYLATLTGPGTYIQAFGFGAGGSVAIAGQPGDPVTFCANGYGWGYSKGCATINLPATADQAVPLPLELSAEGRGNIAYSLRTASGAKDPDRAIELVATNGEQVLTQEATVGDGILSVTPGTWDLTVIDPATSQVLADGPIAVQSGVDSATFRQLSPAAPYSGLGNGLVALQQSASPGGGIDVSASWSPSTATPASTLVVTVPPSTSVQPAVAATVNGAPVSAALVDGTLRVPIPAVPAGGAGHATVHLAVAADADADAVAIKASIGTGPLQPLGMAVVRLPAVTLFALPRVASRTLTVTGRAHGGAAVKVFADGVLVGSATTSSSGAWQAAVILPQGEQHALVATSGGESSESATVVIDRFAPTFDSVTVSQPGIRSYTREPGATYPFIVAPTVPMTVTTTMEDASRLASADVVIDDVHHPMTRDGDHWEATFVAGQPRGDIDIEYVEAPLPTDLTLADWTPPKPTLAEFMSSLPPAQAQDLGDPDVTVDDDGHHAHVKVPAGHLDITTSDGTGVSVAGKEQLAQGVWVLSGPSLSISGDVVSGSVTLLIHDPAVTGNRPIGGKLPPKAPDTVVAVVFVLGTGALSGYESWTAKDKYEKLEALLNAASSCGPDASQQYRNKLDDLRKEALDTDLASAMMQVAGVVLGPETFGIATIALWATSEVYGKLLDKRMDDLLDAAKAQIDSDPDCPGGGGGHGPGPGPSGPGGPGRDPLTHPIWIYDPSGTITDGVDPIAGATATLTRADTQQGSYTVWNAQDYEQDNDLVTGGDGHYGWNVPEGWYVVTATAPGRTPASSAPLQVLPPRTGIDLVLGPNHLPLVTSATAAGAVATVSFEGWMDTAFLTDNQLTLTDSAGHPVVATVTPVGTRTGTDGGSYARSVTLTVPTPATATTLTLTVGAGVQDVIGRPMAQDFTSTVTFTPAPPPPPTDCSKQQQAAVAAAAAAAAAQGGVTAAKAALTKASKKLAKLKKAHASVKKVKAAKKKVKAAKAKVAAAQTALAEADAASAASAAAAAACH